MALRVILGLLLVLLCTVPTVAAAPPGNGEVGLDFGVTDIDPLLGGRSTFRLSFRGGYHFNRRFELEGRVGGASHYHRRTATSSGQVDVTLASALVSGVLNFPSDTGRFVPYIQAGVGFANLNFGSFGPDESATAYELAAGGRLFFGETGRTAFRFEVSRLFADVFGVNGAFDSLAFGFCWRVGEGGS